MNTTATLSNDGVDVVAYASGAHGRPTAIPSAVDTTAAVVLPVYNEANALERTFKAVAAFAMAHPNITLVFADDGSTDQTAAILANLIGRHEIPNLRLIPFSENRGKGRTIQAAFEQLDADHLCFMDGDLAYSPDHLPALIEALRTHDVVIGSRSLADPTKATTAPLRRVLGEGFNRLARWTLGLHYQDTQAGLKGFRLEAARTIFSRQRLAGFAFDAELLFLAHRHRLSVGEVPAHVADHHAAKPSKVNLIRDPLRMLGALLHIRFTAMLGRYD